MSKKPDKMQYLTWAAKARGQAEEATTPAARALHLSIAADYDAKAADAPEALPEASDEAPPVARE